MWAFNKSTGDYMQGELKGDIFVVQTGADFDPNHEVFALDEITLNDELDFPTELDNEFSDADMDARQDIAVQLAEEQENARVTAAMLELIHAGSAYLETLDKAMEAVEFAAFDYWDNKSDA